MCNDNDCRPLRYCQRWNIYFIIQLNFHQFVFRLMCRAIGTNTPTSFWQKFRKSWMCSMEVRYCTSRGIMLCLKPNDNFQMIFTPHFPVLSWSFPPTFQSTYKTCPITLRSSEKKLAPTFLYPSAIVSFKGCLFMFIVAL
jgi:hypothetical protein